MNTYQKLTIQENTSKWLRKRVSKDIIRNSISSLLTSNSEINNKPNTINKNKIKINSTQHTQNNLQINPEYLYTKQTLKKIIKLRNIFLEFDEDGSKMLELHELITMFETNHIPASMNDLIKLFFKEDFKFKTNEEPYLDFYQLILFALDSGNEYQFRNFMRKIKDKINMNIKLKNINKEIKASKNNNSENSMTRKSFRKQNTILVKIQAAQQKAEEGIRNSIEKRISLRKSLKMGNENEDMNIRFLPMDFNLLLEYLNSKGKMRESEQIINKMTEKMDGFEVEMSPKKEIKINTRKSLEFSNNLNSKNIIKSKIENKNNYLESDIDLTSVVKNFKRMLYHSRISSDDNDFFKNSLRQNNMKQFEEIKKNENLPEIENKTYYTQESVISDILIKKKIKRRSNVSSIGSSIENKYLNKIIK